MFSKLAPGFPVSDSSFGAICFIGSTKSDQLQGGDTSFQGRDITHVPVRPSCLSLARWQDTSRSTFCLLAVLTYSPVRIYHPAGRSEQDGSRLLGPSSASRLPPPHGANNSSFIPLEMPLFQRGVCIASFPSRSRR